MPVYLDGNTGSKISTSCQPPVSSILDGKEMESRGSFLSRVWKNRELLCILNHEQATPKPSMTFPWVTELSSRSQISVATFCLFVCLFAC